MSLFAKRFREERKKKGLTQQELAELFHTDKSSISKYENDHSMPELPILQEYAKFFGVSIDYLLGNTEERNPADEIINKNKEKEIEVKELLSRYNVMLDGEALDEEAKDSVIELMNFKSWRQNGDKNNQKLPYQYVLAHICFVAS